MEENTDNNIIILRYIKGQLTDEELRIFEQRMKTDAEFEEEVEFAKKYYKYEQHKEFESALHRFNEQKKEEGFFDEIEQKLAKEMNAPQTEIKPTTKRKWLRPLMAVAAVLLGAFIIWKVLLPPKTTDIYIAQIIIDETIKIPQSMMADRGYITINEKDTLKKAIEYYNNEKYEKAAPLFEVYLADIEGDDTDIRFFLAKAYLSMKPPQLDKALFHLEKAAANRKYREEIVLHRGATYILKGEYDEALIFLKTQQEATKKYAGKLHNLIQEAEHKKQQ